MWHMDDAQRRAELFGILAHELRSPLVTILGCSELLESDSEQSPSEIERYARSIRTAGQSLSEVVTDLIEFCRSCSREDGVVVRCVSLAAFWRGMAARCTMLDGPKTSVDWQSTVPDIVVEFDPAKVTRALWHVVSNAVKFTSEGTVSVRARVEGDMLIVTVRDPGIGIDARHSERVFDPFWQADSSLTRRRGGTGLGLYLARRSLHQLGGQIDFTSRLGSGSTFTLMVPIGSRGALETRPVPSNARPVRGLPDRSHPAGGEVDAPPAVPLPPCNTPVTRRRTSRHRGLWQVRPSSHADTRCRDTPAP